LRHRRRPACRSRVAVGRSESCGRACNRAGGSAGWPVVSSSRLVLQPLPELGSIQQHARLVDGQRRIPHGSPMSREHFPVWVYGTGDEPDPRFTFANERTYLAWIPSRVESRALWWPGRAGSPVAAPGTETAWLSAAPAHHQTHTAETHSSPGRLVPADRQAPAQVLKDLGPRLASGRGVLHSFPARRGSRNDHPHRNRRGAGSGSSTPLRSTARL
jgi:hypothetical protein